MAVGRPGRPRSTRGRAGPLRVPAEAVAAPVVAAGARPVVGRAPVVAPKGRPVGRVAIRLPVASGGGAATIGPMVATRPAARVVLGRAGRGRAGRRRAGRGRAGRGRAAEQVLASPRARPGVQTVAGAGLLARERVVTDADAHLVRVRAGRAVPRRDAPVRASARATSGRTEAAPRAFVATVRRVTNDQRCSARGGPRRQNRAYRTT